MNRWGIRNTQAPQEDPCTVQLIFMKQYDLPTSVLGGENFHSDHDIMESSVKSRRESLINNYNEIC